jgi:hypothetical protein
VITVDTSKSYTSSYGVSGFTGNSFSASFSVSPVPLPAGLPLFALALFALGIVGYRAARKQRADLQVA